MTENSDLENWGLFGSMQIAPIRSYFSESSSLELLNDAKKLKTELYDSRILVIRRGAHFFIRHKHSASEKVQSKNLSVKIERFLEQRSYFKVITV